MFFLCIREYVGAAEIKINNNNVYVVTQDEVFHSAGGCASLY